MIFSPPTLVPRPITVLHISISQAGMTIPVTLSCPPQKAMPRKSTPMNFCPSWAPCMKLMAAAAKICAPWKKPLVFLRSIPAHTRMTRRQMPHPARKPSARLSTRP